MVVRKHMELYPYCRRACPSDRTFYEEHVNPYLNFHRPCGQPELITSSKGKQKRVYRWYATPWEMLRRLPGVAGYLKPELTIEALDQVVRAQSDTVAAETMQAAKRKLLASFHQRRSA